MMLANNSVKISLASHAVKNNKIEITGVNDK